MPRLRNVVTGVVVNVSDDVAATLGAGWSPVRDGTRPVEPEPAPRRAPRRKK